jgi:hypothetical protein
MEPHTQRLERYGGQNGGQASAFPGDKQFGTDKLTVTA